MRVLLDTSPLQNGNSGRGVGTYTRELWKALKALPEKEALTIESTLETIDARDTFDLIHYPYFDLFFATLPKRRHTPMVVTVHDVIPLVFPDQYPPGIRGRWRFSGQKRRLNVADAVITDSQASKADIVKYLGVSEHKVHVVYLAASPDLQTPSEYFQEKLTQELGLPDRYIVYVGDINYNKNLPTLLLALTSIENVHLVVVSRTFHNTAIPEGQQLAESVKANDLGDRVHVLDIPSDKSDVLAAVLSKARCLIQPSLYEGFGLPVLEAMQVGVPVVCTNGGSLPEVAGGAAIMVEPTISGLEEGIREALHLRGDERQARIDAGKLQAAKFSWEKTAAETLAVYKQVLLERE